MTPVTHIPKDAKCYARSPDFNRKTVPEKLLSDHNLKAGTWGKLIVIRGEIRYFNAGSKAPDAIILAPESHVIPTQQMHFIQVSEEAEFYIEFWRR